MSELGDLAKEAGQVIEDAAVRVETAVKEEVQKVERQVLEHTVPSLLALLHEIAQTTIDRKLKLRLTDYLGLTPEPDTTGAVDSGPTSPTETAPA